MKLFQSVFNRVKEVSRATENKPVEYYLLECWNQYADLPEILFPFVDKVKSREEWLALGFPMRYNSQGQIRKIKINNKYFSFIRIEADAPDEAEAIRTGKRLTSINKYVELLLQKGCTPDEFLTLQTA